MNSDRDGDLLELKSELSTVVEALSVLHDFIESVFGTKYQNFVNGNGNSYRSGGGASECGENGNPTAAKTNIQSALQKLRWKHSWRNDDVQTFSAPSSIGIRSRESTGENGYSSVGTPTPSTTEGRRDSVSSQNNQMYSPAASSQKSVKNEYREDNDNDYRFSLSVGRPEVIAVKCEVNDTDFLDDMDPFSSEHGDYQYEGEEPELNIETAYPITSTISSSDHQDNRNVNVFEAKSAVTEESPNTNCSTSSRFIPELIPIQPDPLLHNMTHNYSSNKLQENEGEESRTNSSDNSDTEWLPSEIYNNAKAIKKEKKRKLPIKRPSQTDRKLTTNFVTNFSSNIPLPRQQATTSSNSVFGGNGGLFKCDMCPASYKQEESLRSHQKYKHNPSRVTCTCPICGKKMVDKYRLQRHLRLHTGEKPFECEYCHQSFYRKDYHTKHLQRKHGISYNAGAPSKPLKKPIVKQKPAISSPSPSSFTVSSSSSASSSSFQSLRSGVFETPSPPSIAIGSCPRKPSVTSALVGNTGNRASFTTSPSSVSSVTTSSPIISTGEMKEVSNFIDVFSSQSSQREVAAGQGIYSSSNASEICSISSGGISNLMTMTSLTFDDLISADL